MARNFTGSSADYLDSGVTSPWDFGTGDFTLSALVRTTDTNSPSVFGCYSGGNDYWLGLFSGAAAFSRNGNVASESPATVNDGVWHQLGGSRVGSTHYVYVDGVQKGSSSPGGSSSPNANLLIGKFSSLFAAPFPGDIAEAAVWGAGLTAAQHLMLAARYSPLLVAPESLIAYWPIVGRGSPEVDLVGGYSATVNGTTTVAHPRIIYPKRRQARRFTTATGGGGGGVFALQHIHRFVAGIGA